jgi:preprotein translocase subunit SecB
MANSNKEDQKLAKDNHKDNQNAKTNGASNTAQPTDNRPEFVIQSVYVKDVSFESPSTPAIFKEQWHPDLNLQLQASTNLLEENVHEVSLAVTVTVKSNEKIAFIAEVKQSGIFTIKNFSPDQLHAILGSVCPGILYPYARERIANLVTGGGFPQLALAPLDFDALYHQQMAQQKQSADATKIITEEEQG